MSIAAGTKLGRYEIRSQIGAGGMGEVYLAEDTRLHRNVALKVLPAKVASNQDRMRRFNQEATAAAALNHPHIAHIYEIGESQGTHFIAMESIDGVTLRDKIHRDKAPLTKLLKYLTQVAEGLAKAHSAGIVHRDLKPDNVMITREDYAKILDFGLAKLVELQSPSASSGTSSEIATAVMPQHSLPGTVMGTVGYMSPEQAQGRVHDIDHRSDVFSFGCLLFEAATRQRAFSGKDALDSLHKIVYAPTPQIKEFNANAPDELQRIVRRCLAKEPERRYQSIKEVAIELEELGGEMEREHSGPTVAPSLPESASTHLSQRGATDAFPTSTHLSSAEYLVDKIRQHKSGTLLILGMVIAVVSATAYFAYSRHFAASGDAGIRSIAVLPFANESKDPNMEYLSDGISESLIDNLSELPGVKVIARSSSFKYKGKEVDPQEVAKALNVQAVVAGRVLQRGDGLQISAELINASDKTQLWGAQYNRKSSDLLNVQSEISGEIAEKLRLKLTSAQQQQLARRATTNPEAYELVLKGRFVGHKGVTEGRKKAHEYFQQAIALDPNYALAYAELSGSYKQLVVNGILDQKEAMPKAEAAVRKALELDENLAEAHLAFAVLKEDAWDWAAAEREFKRAIELNPNLARAHDRYSYYLSVMGRHEQAMAEIIRARELDPLSLPINMGVAYRFYFARQYDQAIEVLKKTLELDQNYPNAQITLGYTYMAKGMYPQAVAAYQEAIRLGDDSMSTKIYLGAAYAKGGERDKAQAILKRLQTSEGYVSPGELAILYTALGEREQAFASLEKAYAAHDSQLQFLGIAPEFDGLRSDPHFQDLVRRVGLPQ